MLGGPPIQLIARRRRGRELAGDSSGGSGGSGGRTDTRWRLACALPAALFRVFACVRQKGSDGKLLVWRVVLGATLLIMLTFTLVSLVVMNDKRTGEVVDESGIPVSFQLDSRTRMSGENGVANASILGTRYWEIPVKVEQFEGFRNFVAGTKAWPHVEKRLHICLVTCSLVGPTKNGGIATAMTALTESLQGTGRFNITVLYAWGSHVQSRTIDHWVDHYRQKGIHVVPLPRSKLKLLPASPSEFVTMAYQAYEWLVEHDGEFDAVYTHEWHGIAYFAGLAKRQGLHMQRTMIVTVVHCPSLFYLQGNRFYLKSFKNLASDFLERSTLEMSDVIISPSAFMLKWVQRELGWMLPKNGRIFVQPNIVSNAVIDQLPGAHIRRGNYEKVKAIEVKELVFFGRIEILKGVFLFCDALDMLAERVNEGKLRNVDVTFMGNPNFGKKTSVIEVIEKRAKDAEWPFKLSFLTNKLQPDAVAYLVNRPGRLAVMPSLLENSPYAVLECISLAIPFIASDVGGTSELLHPDDRSRVLFYPHPNKVFALLNEIIASGATMARSIVDAEMNKQLTNEFHIRLIEEFVLNRPADVTMKRNEEMPLISVCIAHRNRGSLLLKTIEAVLEQTYPNIELIIVDDGSNDEISMQVLNALDVDMKGGSIPSSEIIHAKRSLLRRFELIRTENRFPGAARNTAVLNSRGKWIAILDDDDIPHQTWLSTMMSVAQHVHADIVTPMCDFFKGSGSPSIRTTDLHLPSRRWVSLGNAPALGMFHNVFGAYAGLFRKSAFIGLGGYSEDFGSTFEDWELYARASVRGLNLQVVPDPLLWYRQSGNKHLMQSTDQYLNRMRALRAYTSLWPPEMRGALYMGYGKAFQSLSSDKL